jgi:heptosyltransferase-2
VDRVIPFDAESCLWLPALEFDVAVNFDKSLRSGGLLDSVRAREKRGFGLSPSGAIIPVNAGAEYTYRLGLDDALKFAGNERTVPELVCEIAEVEYAHEPYRVHLSDSEIEFARRTRDAAGAAADDLLIGLNTGASAREPAKRLPFEIQAELLRRMARACPDAILALLGGPAETEWNDRLAAACGVPVKRTPGEENLRRGLCHVAACDVVVTGDTAALHLAVALERYVVAWFGPTAHAEIDLFGRGEKILSSIPPGPSWAEEAARAPRFPLDLDRIVEAVARVPGPEAR